MINSELNCHYDGSSMSDSSTYITINETPISLNIAGIRSSGYEKDSNNTTIYLEKGTIINFYNTVSIGTSKYHYVSIKMFALFK